MFEAARVLLLAANFTSLLRLLDFDLDLVLDFDLDFDLERDLDFELDFDLPFGLAFFSDLDLFLRALDNDRPRNPERARDPNRADFDRLILWDRACSPRRSHPFNLQYNSGCFRRFSASHCLFFL